MSRYWHAVRHGHKMYCLWRRKESVFFFLPTHFHSSTIQANYISRNQCSLPLSSQSVFTNEDDTNIGALQSQPEIETIIKRGIETTISLVSTGLN